jgi:glycosyltransferase involved in cell wall biosynthesis
MSSPVASVLVPAHNEGAVLARLLTPLAPALTSRAIELVVVCNGCTDNTATVARSFPTVRVIELESASKTDALRAGDLRLEAFPRFYVDADVELPLQALYATAQALSSNGKLAGRPRFRYELASSKPLIRSFYTARITIPSIFNALWGAGVYVLTEAGRRRFQEFPDVVADDLWVDGLFAPSEIAIVPCEPVVVHVPTTVRGLLGTLTRVYDGNRLTPAFGQPGPAVVPHGSPSHTFTELARGIDSAHAAYCAGVYAGFVTLARLLGLVRPQSRAWYRDSSSRTGISETARG